MSTSTERLVERSANDEQNNTTNDTTYRYRAVSKHLKLHTFAFSTITFGCLVATFILIKKAPFDNGSFNWPRWEAQRTTKELGKWILASLFISIVNFMIPFHSLINLIVNITFPSGIIVKLVPFFQSLPTSSWCARYGRPPQYPQPGPLPDEPECLEKKKVIKIMMVVTGVLASLLAANYILHALLRGIIILKSRFWEKSSWSIPTGNYTFQISLNVVRRDSEETEPTGSHGPVHL